MSEIKIRLVCATRVSLDEFTTQTALGKSLAVYGYYPFVEARVFDRNTDGLSKVYNAAIDEAASSPAILVFVHDDVHLCDFHWPLHLLEGLEQFHIVGIAGNIRRLPRQPSWAFRSEARDWDARANLSGTVAHGTGFPCKDLNFFGPSMQEVKLLDGLLLACKSRLLQEKGIRFDERFDFNFYDLDFCRQAEQKGLRMGTWPISLVHESVGEFTSAEWKDGYRKYLDKWQD